MNHLDALWGRWVAFADLDALGQLFDETAPGLKRLASFMARDSAAADDALQGTYLAALERPKALGDEGRVEAWLSGILVRQVRRQQRSAARGGGVVTPDEVLTGLPSVEPSPAGQAAGAELEDRLGRLIDELPVHYAEPLRRKLLGGDSAHVIAVELGLESSMVHTRLSRGLAKLREALPAGFAAPALAQLGDSSSAAEALMSIKAGVLEHAGSQPTSAIGAVAGRSTATWLGSTGGLAVLFSLVVGGGLWWLKGPAAEESTPWLVAADSGSMLTDDLPVDDLDALKLSPQEGGRVVSVASGVEGAPAVVKHWSGGVVPRVPGVRVHRLEVGTLEPLELLATTEEDGRFSFTGPAELEHQIGFFLEGHTVWASPLSCGQRLRSDRDSSRRADGEKIWFGDPRLLPGAAASGRVQDAHGAPVAGATLYVTSRRMLAADQHDRPFGVTARDGSFALDSVVAHEDFGQVLFAVAPDGRTGWTLFGCPEGKREITDLEVTVPDVFSGWVEVLDDASSEPIVGARVHLSPAAGPIFEHSQSGRALLLESRVRYFFLGQALGAAWSSDTGTDGWAELSTIPAVPGQGVQIEGVKPLACWVTATAPGYEIARSQVLQWFPEDNALSEAPAWRDLFSGKVSLRMKRAPEPEGSDAHSAGEAATVPDSVALPLTVRVVDETGGALDGFRVSAVQEGRSLGRAGLQNGGRWSWAGADAGEWTVRIYDPLVMRDFQRQPIHTVALRGGSEEHLIQIRRPAPDPAGQVTLELRAKGTLESLDPTAWSAFRQQNDGHFQSEPVSEIRALEGALRLANLPPGKWWIKVQARDHAESEIRFELADGEDRVLQIDLSEESMR